MTNGHVLILERVVNGRLHRTVLKNAYFGPAYRAIEVWQRAMQMGIEKNLMDILGQIRS